MSVSSAGHDFTTSPLSPDEQVCRNAGCLIRRKHPNGRSSRWLYWGPGEKEWRLRRLKCKGRMS